VPAPDEPVTAITGCLWDIVNSPEGIYKILGGNSSRMPSWGLT
jgi:hypothetical protein